MRTKFGRRLRRLLAVEPLESRDVPSATHYLLTGPPVAASGSAVSVIVQAVDALGAIDLFYTGTIHFTSTDQQAGLPPDYTFGRADGGQHQFSVTLTTPGSQTITGTDASSPNLTRDMTVAVTYGVKMTVSPADLTAGQTVTLNGMLATANDFAVNVTLSWGDDSPATNVTVLAGETTFTAQHTYDQSSDQSPQGAFTIQATPSEGDGPPLFGAASVMVDPALDVTMDEYYAFANVGRLVTLSGTYTNLGAKSLTATVNFDDGSAPQPVTLRTDGTFTVSHAFTEEDVYDVTVTLDDGVNSASDYTEILVFPPQLENGASQSAPAGGQATASAPGVTAQVDHAAGAARPAVLTVGRYDILPITGVAVDGPTTAAYEVRLAGATPDDRVTVTVAIPSGFGDGVRLAFYDPHTHTFRPVQPSSIIVDEAAHTITLLLDESSFPRVTDLHGTIFTVSVALPEVPTGSGVVGVSFVSTSAAPSPSSFSSAGVRTLTLSPSSDGGPGAGKAFLSGERPPDDDATAVVQAAPAPDPWAVGAEVPLAGLGPDGGAGEGDGVPADDLLLWPLAPAAVVPPWSLTLPQPKESNDHGSLPRPSKDDFWASPTPQEGGTSAAGAAAALALIPGLILGQRTRRRTIPPAGENLSVRCPI